MPRFGLCQACADAGAETPAILCIDGTPVCKEHARGDKNALAKLSSRLPAPELDVPPTPAPRLVRRSPIAPRSAPLRYGTSLRENATLALSNLPPLAQRIVSATVSAFQIQLGDLWHRSNQPEFVLPRQALVYLLRQNTNLSYPQLGCLLGLHHTTLLYGYRVMSERLGADESLTLLLEGITNAALAMETQVAA